MLGLPTTCKLVVVVIVIIIIIIIKTIIKHFYSITQSVRHRHRGANSDTGR